MDKKNILVVGVGGQGTLIASRILGNLAKNREYDVKISEVHGMAQRGGSVVTHVRYGKKVHSPLIEIGRADIILAFEKLEALRWAHYLKEEGLMIINDQKIEPMIAIIGSEQYPMDIEDQIKKICYKAIFVNAIKISKKLGSTRVSNTVLLGELAKHLQFNKEEWERSIEDIVPEKSLHMNKSAFYNCYDDCFNYKDVICS